MDTLSIQISYACHSYDKSINDDKERGAKEKYSPTARNIHGHIKVC
jgi:hypothetical protein